MNSATMNMPAPPAGLPTPAQPRSQRAQERFLDVGARLLSEDRFEETGIAELARDADSSVGTFYRVLGDKERLLNAVQERFIAESRARLAAAFRPDRWHNTTVEARVVAFVAELRAIFEEQEGLLRALIRRSSSKPQFAQRFHAVNAFVSDVLVALLQDRLERADPPVPMEAVRLSAHVVLAAMNYYTLTGTLGPGDPARAVQELATMVLRYLREQPNP